MCSIHMLGSSIADPEHHQHHADLGELTRDGDIRDETRRPGADKDSAAR